MILSDTSVWIEHFRNSTLAHHIDAGLLVMHPMVLGELACGNLPVRHRTLQFLAELPRAIVPPDEIVFQAIDLNRWSGTGIGWVDAHLLATALASKIPLWTLDLRLHNIARAIGAA